MARAAARRQPIASRPHAAAHPGPLGVGQRGNEVPDRTAAGAVGARVGVQPGHQHEPPLVCPRGRQPQLRVVARPMTKVFTTGTKPVFRMRLASGRTIDATANHKFYTYDGWAHLGDLSVGARPVSDSADDRLKFVDHKPDWP